MPEIKIQVVQISESAAEGTARNHSIFIDRPEAKGGSDKGPMGGEYFLMGLGGCFMSNLLAAIKAREAAVKNVKIEITGSVDDEPARYTAVNLNISAEYSDRDLMTKLVTIAERGCLVANSIKKAVELSSTIA
ncbi:MAG: OsmC family protein [SAR324 cluster bacterium]|nr:OsmC family protein [SAR324 cluster bacterium]